MVLHFLIQGRVQGVGFRWFVHREASELDLRGWVRNTEDGDVEVVVSGTAEDLAELRASLRRGPRGSRVDRLVEHYLDDERSRRSSTRSESTGPGSALAHCASVSRVLASLSARSPVSGISETEN